MTTDSQCAFNRVGSDFVVAAGRTTIWLLDLLAASTAPTTTWHSCHHFLHLCRFCIPGVLHVPMLCGHTKASFSHKMMEGTSYTDISKGIHSVDEFGYWNWVLYFYGLTAFWKTWLQFVFPFYNNIIGALLVLSLWLLDTPQGWLKYLNSDN